ncbi:MAG: RluA family pseudouridine synthase [Bdellovibrionota bacterium]
MSPSEPAVLWEDGAVLIVGKPAGWLTVPTPKKETKTLLHWASDYVKRHGGKKAYVVHRLDRETSGAIALAKTPEAQQSLEKQFREHKPGRTYLALVQGVPAKKKDRLVHRLVPDPAQRGVERVSRNPRLGVEAVTEYEVLEAFGGVAALLEVKPQTGRTNQIRVQLAHVGHPLVGDRKYSKAGKFSVRAARTLLHAQGLSFRHPVTGKTLEARAPLPGDFEEVLIRLRPPEPPR